MSQLSQEIRRNIEQTLASLDGSADRIDDRANTGRAAARLRFRRHAITLAGSARSAYQRVSAPAATTLAQRYGQFAAVVRNDARPAFLGFVLRRFPITGHR